MSDTVFNNRTFYNPEDIIADPKDAFDLHCQSAKLAAPFSTLGNSGYRKAIVVEAAQGLSAAEAEAFGGPGMDTKRMTTFRYVARLVDDWAPHKLVPNPCDPAVSTSKNTDLGVCHIMVVGSQDSKYGTKISINVGDYVDIDLEEGVFLKNLQKARHASMASRPSGRSSHGLTCPGTKNLAKNFNKMPETETITVTQEQFVQALKDATGISFRVTSYTRSLEQQVQAMSNPSVDLSQYENGSLKPVADILLKWRNTKDAPAKEALYEDALNKIKSLAPGSAGRHTTGLAVDIGTKDLTVEQIDQLRLATLNLGGRVNLEAASKDCFGDQTGAGTKTAYGTGNLKRNTAGENCGNQHLHIDWDANWAPPATT